MAKAKNLSNKNGRSAGDTSSLWKTSKPVIGGNLPRGTYEGYIKPGTWIIEPKKDGGDKSSFTLVVTAPEEYEGRMQIARFDLSTEFGIGVFKGQLITLGFEEPQSISEAAELLSETDGLYVRFYVSEPKDEFPPSVRINERLDEPEETTGPGEESEGGEVETPSELPTRDDIKKMHHDELASLAEENDIDPDDYPTDVKLRKEIYAALGV
jgi:hypothetical protein